MMKLIATSAFLFLAATAVHADNACFSSCDAQCLKTGSLARDCQLECTQECPPTQSTTPTCTIFSDSSAHDSCVAAATAKYAACVSLLGPWPLGGWCTANYINQINACPGPVQTTVCH